MESLKKFRMEERRAQWEASGQKGTTPFPRGEPLEFGSLPDITEAAGVRIV